MRWFGHQKDWKPWFAWYPTQLGHAFDNAGEPWVWLEWVEWKEVPGVYKKYWNAYRLPSGVDL